MQFDTRCLFPQSLFWNTTPYHLLSRHAGLCQGLTVPRVMLLLSTPLSRTPSRLDRPQTRPQSVSVGADIFFGWVHCPELLLLNIGRTHLLVRQAGTHYCCADGRTQSCPNIRH